MDRHRISAPGAIPATARKRAVAFFVTLFAAFLLIAFGISHEETGEVMFNACMLCLSCIGIG
ncbi:MAG: hypothetical protein OHK0028_17950 [Deltaproteobacteria bacterium]